MEWRKTAGISRSRYACRALESRTVHVCCEEEMPVTSLMEYQRVWLEGLNRGDVSAADAAFAPDCVVHLTGVADPIRGVGAWKETVGAFLRAFPDIQFTMEDQIVDGDRVALRWHATATHTGPLGAARHQLSTRYLRMALRERRNECRSSCVRSDSTE